MATKKQQLLEKLRELAKWPDYEDAHQAADLALLEFIDDTEISKAYFAVDRQYCIKGKS